jgi:hypothetical protein
LYPICSGTCGIFRCETHAEQPQTLTGGFFIFRGQFLRGLSSGDAILCAMNFGKHKV